MVLVLVLSVFVLVLVLVSVLFVLLVFLLLCTSNRERELAIELGGVLTKESCHLGNTQIRKYQVDDSSLQYFSNPLYNINIIDIDILWNRYNGYWYFESVLWERESKNWVRRSPDQQQKCTFMHILQLHPKMFNKWTRKLTSNHSSYWCCLHRPCFDICLRLTNVSLCSTV